MDYFVTLMNSIKLNGTTEFYHTWLKFENSLGFREFFSLRSEDHLICVFTCNCHIESTPRKEIQNRIGTESKKFKVSKAQFQAMLGKSAEILNKGYKYSLLQLHESEHSCVSAVRDVLAVGGIHFLSDVNTPPGIGEKINNRPYFAIDFKNTLLALLPRTLLSSALFVMKVIPFTILFLILFKIVRFWKNLKN